MNINVKDSVVLITGANRGIGRAFAEEFLKKGAKRIYLGVRKIESVQDWASKDPERLIPIQLDVTNESHIQAAFDRIEDLDILVNNAGVLHMGDLWEDGRIDDARHEMEVNYFGPLLLTRKFAPVLRQSKHGAVVNIASVASFIPFPGLPTYCASKSAVHFLTMALRMELAAQNTHVLGVYPGPVDTDMAKDIEMEKVSANSVVLEVIQGLESGKEEVLPDPYAKEMYAIFLENPKEAEIRMRQFFEEMKKAA